MRLIVRHHSNYTYTAPIFLEPQHLHFHPLHRDYFSVIEFHLDITPTPAGLSARVDAEGNPYHQCWFSEKISSFQVSVRLDVALNAFNPFDFYIEEPGGSQKNEALKLYLQHEKLSDDLLDWAREIHHSNGSEIIGFLSATCDQIHRNWDHQVRYESSLHSPNQCFEEKKGSCRDLSWMLIHVLRHFAIPARFVSGYSYNPELGEGHELHAWVEVWVSGAGWVGLDQSSGLFTNEYYIPVAASYHPFHTLPIHGSYRGEADSSLETSVELSLSKT